MQTCEKRSACIVIPLYLKSPLAPTHLDVASMITALNPRASCAPFSGGRILNLGTHGWASEYPLHWKQNCMCVCIFFWRKKKSIDSAKFSKRLDSFSFLFLATHEVNGSSWARDQIWAPAVTYSSCSNVGSWTYCAGLGMEPAPLQWPRLQQLDS